eukprot:13051626-Ditylum_brightwellii.AAC.1
MLMGSSLGRGVHVSTNREGVFPAKKLCFDREFLAWANLGICGVIVGCVIDFTLGWAWFVAVPQGYDGGKGLMIRIDDLISLFQFHFESYNAVNVTLAGKGQFFILPGVAAEHGFVFCICKGLVELESCLFIIATCVLEHLECLGSIVAELVYIELEVTKFDGQ